MVLRGGVHYVPDTITLGPQHSNVHFINYPNESPEVSGGVELNLKWSPYNTSNGANIYVADVGSQVTDIPGLQLDGVRATRARYPNIPGGIESSYES